MHPCTFLFSTLSEKPIIGDVDGICRITGQPSKGILFNEWVRDTFTDHSYLHSGIIISNEALFCFEESSILLQKLTNKDKPQRFRNYSHIISNGKWYLFTKADKKAMFELISTKECELVCIAESGQKHIFFKNQVGLWQLEEKHVFPDKEKLLSIHKILQKLYELGFTQEEIISGNYPQNKIFKIGFPEWNNLENQLKKERGTAFFNFTAFFMYKSE